MPAAGAAGGLGLGSIGQLVAVFVAAVAITALLGAAISRVLTLPLRHAPPLNMLLMTMMIGTVIRETIRLFCPDGTNSRRFPELLPKGGLTAGGVFIRYDGVILLFAGVALIAFVNWLVTGTRFGLAMRAVSEDQETARVMGVDFGRIVPLAFALGSATAGFAGACPASITRDQLRHGRAARHHRADVLTDVSIVAKPGRITCILGSNGAGKSTLIRSILRLTPPRAGSISIDGRTVDGLATHEIVRLGIGCIPEGRHVFSKMTVVGKSIQEYSRDLRLIYGLWLLAHSDKTITPVATESGFSDVPHFNRLFRASLGCLPSAMRRRGPEFMAAVMRDRQMVGESTRNALSARSCHDVRDQTTQALKTVSSVGASFPRREHRPYPSPRSPF